MAFRWIVPLIWPTYAFCTNCRLVTRWNEDPLSLVSYSFPRPSAAHPHLPFLRASLPVWPSPLPTRAPANVSSLKNSISSLTAHSPEHVHSLSSPAKTCDTPLVSFNPTLPFLPGSSGIAPHESEPLYRLYFAGEHCSVLRCGYADGAYESGVEAAKRVICSLVSSFTATNNKKPGSERVAKGENNIATSKL